MVWCSGDLASVSIVSRGPADSKYYDNIIQYRIYCVCVFIISLAFPSFPKGVNIP